MTRSAEHCSSFLRSAGAISIERARALTPLGYPTGHGFAFQISAAYSAIVRSLEKRPELATLMIAFCAHSCGFL